MSHLISQEILRCCFFKDQVPCSPGWPLTCCVAKVDLEHLILLPPLLQAWGDKHASPHCFCVVLMNDPSTKACQAHALPTEPHLKPWETRFISPLYDKSVLAPSNRLVSYNLGLFQMCNYCEFPGNCIDGRAISFPPSGNILSCLPISMYYGGRSWGWQHSLLGGLCHRILLQPMSHFNQGSEICSP